MCENIDLFNKCCVAILGKLYSEFPVPTLLQTSKALELAGFENFDDKLCEIYSETVSFLHDEGYVSIGSEAGRGTTNRIFMDVRLTSKGLAALNRSPKKLEHAPSIGERISGWTGELIKDVSREAVKGAVQAFLGG